MQQRIKKLSMNELNRKSVDEFKRSEKIPVVIVLENIRSMYNVGSVFRSADAFLIEGIFISGYTAQPPRKEIDKTALGATESVNWKYFSTTREALEELKKDDFKVFAIEQVEESLLKHFGTQSLKGFGVDHFKEGIIAAGAVLHYLKDTEHPNLQHITSLQRIDRGEHLWMDRFTIRNLELLRFICRNKASHVCH